MKKKIKERKLAKMERQSKWNWQRNQILEERCCLISLIGQLNQSYKAELKMASSRLILLTIDTNPAFHQEVPRIETPRKFQSRRDSRPTNDKWKIGSTALTSHSRDCSLSRKAYSLETEWSRLSWRARRLRVRQLNTKSHSPNQLSRLSSMTRRRKRRTILR